MHESILCGKLNEVVTDKWEQLLGLFGIVGIVTVIIQIVKAVLEVESVIGVFTKVISFLGISTTVGFVIIAIAAYLVTVYLIFRLWYDDCVGDQSGETRCATGVVEKINGESVGAIFNADHPSVDLVTKAIYWIILTTGADKMNCSDAGSPVLKVFFKSDRVCAVKGGAVIGAAVAGAGGVVAAAVAAAAIGCATVWLCALAILVAILIVVAAAIAGAFAGGGIAAAATDEDDPSYDDGDAISVGDYLSAQGPTAKNMNFEGAIVQYFNEASALLGRSENSPSFTHDDPDANVPEEMDACPL